MVEKKPTKRSTGKKLKVTVKDLTPKKNVKGGVRAVPCSACGSTPIGVTWYGRCNS